MKKIILTDLELQILNLLAVGNTRVKIAKMLKISYSRCLSLTNGIIKKFNAVNLPNCILKAISMNYL